MYIALKDLTLSGARYQAGENIPEGAVVPNRAAALMRSGYIAKQGGQLNGKTADGKQEGTISVPLLKSGTEVCLDGQGASAVFEILQETAEEAALSLAQSSREVLLVVKEIDSRKSVRAAAESFLQETAENTGKQ